MKILLICLFLFFLFGSSNANFDENLAKKIVNFAAAAFIPPIMDNGLANQCFAKSWPNGQWSNLTQYTIKPCAGKLTDECEVVITVSEPLKMVVIAFRGTVGKDQMQHESDESLMDYIDWPRNATLGRVNKYFSDAAENVWDNHVETYLKNYKGYKFVFTGHSIGGAVASLTALRARYLGYITDYNLNLYTFGEPRSGDSVLAQTLKNYITNKYRIIHNSDIVPHLPFCSGILSDDCKNKPGKPYHHPQEIWYNNKDLTMDDSKFKVCSTVEGEDSDCSNSISNIEFGYNINSDRGFDMHMHYYDYRLDVYGLSGCTNNTQTTTIAAASYGTTTIAHSLCPNGGVKWQSNCYFFQQNKSAFSVAEEGCNDMGGHLTSIHDGFTNNFVAQKAALFFQDNTTVFDFWIGGFDIISAGNWSWTDNSIFDFTEWNHVKNSTGEDCLAQSLSDGRWNAEDCFKLKPYVCAMSIISTNHPYVDLSTNLKKD